MTYSRLADHSSMVFDANRNEAYARAIRQLVTPGSVVLDVGAGLGLHGLLAAAAGAARVYLVEPQAVVRTALDAARAAGLADRITVLQERIEDVQLPEPVDVIVSVFTGNLLFSEDLLPSLFHARDRHLKPGGRLLPDRAELWLAPLSAPLLHAKHVARWQEPVMGLDYSSARAFAANEILWLPRDEFTATTRMGAGALMADVDMSTASAADCRGEALCRVESSGDCHGLLGWIRIRLLDQWLSTGLDAPEVHWSPVMLPLDPPLPLLAGETVKVALQRPAHGDWTWSIAAQGGSRRHSTFLGRLDGGAELAKAAPSSSPGLGPRGRRVRDILESLDRGLSNQAVAAQLAETEGLDPAQALQEVQALAMRYGGRR